MCDTLCQCNRVLYREYQNLFQTIIKIIKHSLRGCRVDKCNLKEGIADDKRQDNLKVIVMLTLNTLVKGQHKINECLISGKMNNIMGQSKCSHLIQKMKFITRELNMQCKTSLLQGKKKTKGNIFIDLQKHVNRCQSK